MLHKEYYWGEEGKEPQPNSLCTANASFMHHNELKFKVPLTADVLVAAANKKMLLASYLIEEPISQLEIQWKEEQRCCNGQADQLTAATEQQKWNATSVMVTSTPMQVLAFKESFSIPKVELFCKTFF